MQVWANKLPRQIGNEITNSKVCAWTELQGQFQVATCVGE